MEKLRRKNDKTDANAISQKLYVINPELWLKKKTELIQSIYILLGWIISENGLEQYCKKNDRSK